MIKALLKSVLQNASITMFSNAYTFNSFLRFLSLRKGGERSYLPLMRTFLCTGFFSLFVCFLKQSSLEQNYQSVSVVRYHWFSVGEILDSIKNL